MKLKLIRMFLKCSIIMASSAVIAENVFNIDKSDDGKIYIHNKEIINSEGIAFPNANPLNSSAVERNAIFTKTGWNVRNLWSSDKKMPFRREIALSPGGKELELSFQVQLPAYSKGNDSVLSYYFNVPIGALENMKWTAIGGRGTKNEIKTGLLNSSVPDGNFIGTSVRWLAFEGEGRNIIFDFNPEGVGSFSDYGPTAIQGLWSISKEGKNIKCSFGRKLGISGGILNSKVLIFEGKNEDFDKRHANKTFTYFSEMTPEALFSFGAAKTSKMYQNSDLKEYSKDTGYGWSSEKDLKTETASSSGALYSAVTGRGNAVFKYDVKKSGVYLISLRASAFETPSGEFSLSCNGESIAKNIAVNKNSVKTVCWPQWIENGGAAVALSGDWRISTLGFQLLQTSAEDFKFRRGFWLAEDIFEPSVLYRSKDYKKAPDFKVAIDEIGLPSAKEISNMNALPLKNDVCLPDSKNASFDWRYSAVLGSMGPANFGDFTEYGSPQLAEKRFGELKKESINAVITNGFLSRHTFEKQLSRVEETIKMMTAEAHRKGIKIIDHQDLTLLWNLGDGFKYVAEHTDWLQRTVDSGLPNRGLCPVNNSFKAHYFKWITDFIKNTGIDGIMIDEVCFHGSNFCGCKDCRETFHRDTGLILPLDETSPELFNKDSALWRTWLNWRKKAVGDWWVELRRDVNKFKPDFTMLCYTTHYGYYSDYASINYGAGVSNVARGCDFLGTEIMSRNVMASCRSVYAFRNAKNALRGTFNTPVFGLVYPSDDWDIAYFGWAMNNMNGQVTWLITNLVRPEGKSDFINFPLNMDLKTATACVSSALLFSEQSRDWQKHMGFAGEIIGTSETLTDKHFQHTFIFDSELRSEKLKQYKSVLVNSASCLSDEQINALKTYVKDGGNVYLSGNAGTADEMGTLRNAWPLNEIFGITLTVPVKISQTSDLHVPEGKALKTLSPVSYLNSVVSDKSKAKQILFAKSKDNKLIPIGFEATYGKGKFVYCSAQIGSNLYEAEISINAKWTFVKDEKLAALYGDILQHATGKDPIITADEIPENFFVSVYEQPDKDNKKLTMVHLLNGTGVANKKAEDVKGKSFNPAWPELKNDLVFNIPLSSIKEAYVTSPDFAGRKNIAFKKLESGEYQITLPGNLLKSYSIIFLKSDK